MNRADATTDPLPGYRLTRLLGTGAHSRIYLGTDIKTGERFAIKRVVRSSADDDRFLEQCEIEYQFSRHFTHEVLRKSFHLHKVRKLLQLRDVYLVMEFVPGVGLEREMPNRLFGFLALFIRVSEGLRALHASGVVHTDLKPNNIMIAPGGVVKIIDFGQACRIGHRKPRIQGTPDYIAPEQVNREVLTPRTDVFNLGATMYYMLTLKTFPTTISGMDRVGKHSLQDDGKPPMPIDLNPKIPVALSNLVMDCCKTDPRRRPADMDVVLQRLRAVRDLWRKQRDEARERITAERLTEQGAQRTDAWEEGLQFHSEETREAKVAAAASEIDGVQEGERVDWEKDFGPGDGAPTPRLSSRSDAEADKKGGRPGDKSDAAVARNRTNSA